MQQWGRSYKLSVGDKDNGWEIWGLSMSFEVTRSSGEKDNKSSATVSVINLSKEKIKYLQKPYINLELDVGYYGAGLSNLITGEIRDVRSEVQGADFITTFTVSESYTSLNHKVISKLIPDGRKVRDVIDEVIKDIPTISKAVYTGDSVNREVIDGYPINATGREVLDNLSKSFRFEYTIDRGVLYTSDYDKPTNNTTEAILISQDSGLIGRPSKMDKTEGKRGGDVENREGVKFKTLLNTSLVVGGLVKVVSTDISGVFKLSQVVYSGNSVDGDWICDCEAVVTNYES